MTALENYTAGSHPLGYDSRKWLVYNVLDGADWSGCNGPIPQRAACHRRLFAGGGVWYPGLKDIGFIGIFRHRRENPGSVEG